MNLKLEKLNEFHGRKGPLLLIIMDGVGIGKEYDGNAVFKAHKPVLDKLFQSPLYTQLKAHGPAVGLPSEDDMGNSEVGHNAFRHCAGCLERTIHFESGDRIQYYHRQVTLLLVTGAPPGRQPLRMPLDHEVQ